MTTPTCIYRPANYLEPTPWETIFGRVAPVEVDVGTGKGTYLVSEAQRHPERNYLGIDRLLVRLRKADKKVQRLGLTNVRLVRLEASYFVRYLVPTSSVAVYHIYFPDPWPKRRHQRRRLINEEFVEALHRTLELGGEVRFSTDDLNYYQEVVRAFAGHRGFHEACPLPQGEAAQTDFEMLFISKGTTIYRLRWRKC